MKRLLSLTLCLFLLSIPQHLQAQSVFVSSDALIIMTVPSEWTVIENQPQVITAESTTGISATMTYGEALALPQQDNPNAPRGAITIRTESEVQNPDTTTPPITEQLAFLPELLDGEAILTSEMIRQEEVYRLIPLAMTPDTPPETTETVYFVESEFTGLTRIAITGSQEPIVEMLTLYYAYDPPAPVPFDCSAVSLLETQGVPGALIEVTNLPPALENFELQAITQGFDEPQSMFAYATPEFAYVLAPIYPDLRLEGGTTTIQLIHNGIICNEFDFLIEPLTPAPEETQRYAEALQAHINATVDFFNFSPVVLYEPDIPEYLIPIADAQFWVDHPDNPESLVTLLATLTPEELELTDALIASDGFVDALNNRTAIIESQPPLPSFENASIPLENQFVSNDTFPSSQPSPLTVGQQVSINSAEELGYYMRLQAHYQGGAETFSEIANLGDTANNAAGTGVAYAQNTGRMTAGAASRAGFIGAALGTVTFTANTTLGIYQHLLPSEFTSMSFHFDKPRFREEDEDDIYQLENAWVNVRSRSFPVTKTIADAVALVAGNALASKGRANVLDKGDAGKLAKGELSDYASADNAVLGYGVAGQVCGDACANEDTLVLGPYIWTGIEFDFTDEDLKFLRFGIVTSLTGDEPSIEILRGDQKNQYRAIDDGLTVVGIQLEPTAFGGKTISERARIFVDKITIYTDVPIYAKPNLQVCATAPRVDHADDQTLEWEFKRFDSDTPIATEITFGDAPHQFCFTMPEPDESEINRTQSYEECIERERAAYFVTAESNPQTGASTGAREFNGDEQRLSIKTIYTLDEQDICEGLWEVIALRDDENFCDIIPPVATPGGIVANMNFIMDQALSSGGMNSLINIEVLNNGDQLRVTDMLSGRSRTVNRLEEGSNVEDLRVEIILQDQASQESTSDGARAEEWQQGDTEGELVLVRAPSGSTLWLDGQRYRGEVPELENLVANGARTTEPYRVNTLFVSPDLFISVISWRIQGDFAIDGVSYEFDCDIDVVGRGELITGDADDPDDDDPDPTDPDDSPPPDSEGEDDDE